MKRVQESNLRLTAYETADLTVCPTRFERTVVGLQCFYSVIAFLNCAREMLRHLHGCISARVFVIGDFAVAMHEAHGVVGNPLRLARVDLNGDDLCFFLWHDGVVLLSELNFYGLMSSRIERRFSMMQSLNSI